ncbi:MAG: hypothetical protein V1897_00225 [Pseudomonadota bacterium]
MAKIKRSLVKTFLNTGTTGSPVWVLIGDGVTTGKINYNPKILEETYISEDSASITVDSYAPTTPIEMTAKTTDAAFIYIDALRKGRSTLSSAETEVVNVWLYAKPGFTVYPAEKQSVSLQSDDFGGEGGSSAKLNYTINFLGDPVLGAFNPAVTAVFYTEPDTDTTLTTLVLGSGTLDPLFAGHETEMFFTTSIAAATVTVASTKSGATIVQKCNGVTVAQSDPASLDLGANNIVITVAKSGKTSVYNILATRTV